MCRKMKQHRRGASTTEAAFEQLTDSLDSALMRMTNQERVAMEQRGDHPKHFTVSLINVGAFRHSPLS